MNGLQQRRLILVRHAESEANAGLATLDPTTISLTEVGDRQARELAVSWPTAPDLIAVSSYARAQQTAQPLIEKFPDVQLAQWPVHEFTYLQRPPRPTTPAQRSPLVAAYWSRADPLERQSGAESFAEFWARVACVLAMTLEHDAEDLAVVTHGGFMLAFDWQCGEPNAVVDASLMRRFGAGLRQMPFGNGQQLEYRLDVGEQRWHRIGMRARTRP